VLLRLVREDEDDLPLDVNVRVIVVSGGRHRQAVPGKHHRQVLEGDRRAVRLVVDRRRQRQISADWRQRDAFSVALDRQAIVPADDQARVEHERLKPRAVVTSGAETGLAERIRDVLSGPLQPLTPRSGARRP
jgi:hypothetical protein